MKEKKKYASSSREKGVCMSKTKGESVEIEYVAQLPMVNETNKFLVAEKAKDDFSKDLKEFFPFAMEKYILPRLLGLTKDKKRVLLFAQGDPKIILSRRFAPFDKMPEELIGGIENQRAIAQNYLDVANIEELRGKLNFAGAANLGISTTSVFDLSSYDELFGYLVEESTDMKNFKSKLPLLRFYAIYLHNKERYLWPLRHFDKERPWRN